MRETEKDTIDVVTFLKKQDVDKDSDVNNDYIFIDKLNFLNIIQIDRLQQNVKNLKMEHRKENDELVC